MGSVEPIDLSLLGQVARNDLQHLLHAVAGVKDLVIDKSLMRTIDLVANMKMLREHEVGKIYELDASGSHVGWSDSAQHRVYLVKPTAHNAQHIANHWMSEKSHHKGASALPAKRFTALFIPRKLYLCEQIFEQTGVYGEISVEEFNPSLIRLESDVWSLQLPELFSSYYQDNDLTWLHTAAKAMHHLQTLYGPIHKRYCVGTLAKKVHDLLDLQCRQLGQPKPVLSLNERPPFTHLFLFDRAVDWTSLFLTAFTYESLLHETFGIECGTMEVKAGQRIPLNDQDEVYASVRNKFISAVIPFLSGKAKSLITSADQLKQLGVADLKNFVKSDLKGLASVHRSLELHIGASEQIIKQRGGGQGGTDIRRRITHEHNLNEHVRESLAYIEECLCQQQPEEQCLALIALASLTQNGLTARDYEALRRQYLHAHGFQQLSLFAKLRKMGVITEKPLPTGSSSSRLVSKLTETASNSGATAGEAPGNHFQTMAKKLSLIPRHELASRINMAEPHDMSLVVYVFNGTYTPVVCQLLSKFLQSGFDSYEWSRALNCAVGAPPEQSAAVGGLGQQQTPSVLVYMLGGVTYAEIAAFRLLARIRRVRITIAASSIIGQRDVLQLLDGT